jgi:hypothetical protein
MKNSRQTEDRTAPPDPIAIQEAGRQDAKNTKRIIEICVNQPLKVFWRTWRLGGFLFSASC